MRTYNTVLSKIVIGEEPARKGFIALDVAAVLVYDRALQEQERLQVEQYLQRKYFLDEHTQTERKGAEALPEAVVLHANYPNPFNPITHVRFDLPERAAVRLEVFDMLGRQVLGIPAQSFPAGAGQVLAIDASALFSGTYLYQLIVETPTGTERRVGRFTLAR